MSRTLRVRDDLDTANFVVQKHWGDHLHYDLRLEIGDRLVSWALRRGPSLDPTVRRFAVRTADHPPEFARFEGTIPEGQPGAGLVMVWDLGTYDALRPTGTRFDRWLPSGHLKVLLHGERLRGLWDLVRWSSTSIRPGVEAWFLVKLRDRHAREGYDIELEASSALSGRDRAGIERGAESVPPGPEHAPSLV
jgi:bifunctional non-homologous end joining protein LigD